MLCLSYGCYLVVGIITKKITIYKIVNNLVGRSFGLLIKYKLEGVIASILGTKRSKIVATQITKHSILQVNKQQFQSSYFLSSC